MKIAIIGVRGIPGRYGGFETFAENLTLRLVARGHKVTVFNRPGYSDGMTDFQGARIIHIPTVKTKYFDTIVHTLLCVLYVLAKRREFDVVLMCNVGNSPVAWIPRIRGIPVMLNVDGMEWKRKKWPVLAKWYLKLSEKIATYTASAVVTDACSIQIYYAERYGYKSSMIPYGSDAKRNRGADDKIFLSGLGLEPDRYLLYVSRLEPENNADMVVRAFQRTPQPSTSIKLAIVGDAPYSKEYKRLLQSLVEGDGRVVMTGGVYGDGYAILQRNALAYIQATEVGGTHPALVEGMAYGNCVLALDVPEHVEVLRGGGHLFKDEEELTELMTDIMEGALNTRMWGSVASRIARNAYGWETITEQYEALLNKILNRVHKTPSIHDGIRQTGGPG